jgi:hypothetical protein
MNLQFYRLILNTYSNIKFRETPSVAIRVVSCGRTDRQTDWLTDWLTDITKLIAAFRNFANAPSVCKIRVCYATTRRNIPKHLNLHLHQCENLKYLVLPGVISIPERHVSYLEQYLPRFCGPRVSLEYVTNVLTVKLTARLQPVNEIMNNWSYLPWCRDYTQSFLSVSRFWSGARISLP